MTNSHRTFTSFAMLPTRLVHRTLHIFLRYPLGESQYLTDLVKYPPGCHPPFEISVGGARQVAIGNTSTITQVIFRMIFCLQVIRLHQFFNIQFSKNVQILLKTFLIVLFYFQTCPHLDTEHHHTSETQFLDNKLLPRIFF